MNDILWYIKGQTLRPFSVGVFSFPNTHWTLSPRLTLSWTLGLASTHPSRRWWHSDTPACMFNLATGRMRHKSIWSSPAEYACQRQPLRPAVTPAAQKPVARHRRHARRVDTDILQLAFDLPGPIANSFLRRQTPAEFTASARLSAGETGR